LIISREDTQIVSRLRISLSCLRNSPTTWLSCQWLSDRLTSWRSTALN